MMLNHLFSFSLILINVNCLPLKFVEAIKDSKLTSFKLHDPFGDLDTVNLENRNEVKTVGKVDKLDPRCFPSIMASGGFGYSGTDSGSGGGIGGSGGDIGGGGLNDQPEVIARRLQRIAARMTRMKRIAAARRRRAMIIRRRAMIARRRAIMNRKRKRPQSGSRPIGGNRPIGGYPPGGSNGQPNGDGGGIDNYDPPLDQEGNDEDMQYDQPGGDDGDQGFENGDYPEGDGGIDETVSDGRSN